MVKLPHWPKIAGQKPIDLRLDRMVSLLEAVGNPQLHMPPVVHVAGTNGKGSTLALMRSVLQQAGYRVHRYTSPHLVAFNERIEICGEPISDDALYPLLEQCRLACETHAIPITFFEGTTIAAFLAFATHPADIVLLETGMGGRLDATNMIEKPLLTIITPIAMDHAEFLGDTLPKIAAEKAGIIKEGVPCVVAKQVPEVMEVMAARARMLHAPLYAYGEAWHTRLGDCGMTYHLPRRTLTCDAIGLHGEHQKENAGVALAALDLLQGFRLDDAQMQQGIAKASWPARFQHLDAGVLAELVRPASLWLDGGHNAAASKAMAETLKQWHKDKQRIYMVVGMRADKEFEHYIQPLVPYVKGIHLVPVPEDDKSMDPHDMLKTARECGVPATSHNDVWEALDTLKESEESSPTTILICGSLYLAGWVLAQNKRRF